MANRRPSILHVTSNGGGMGHLTRQLAVALAVGDRAESAMMSLSVSLPIVAEHGLRGEYCPSYDRPWINRARWNDYFHDRLVALAREKEASVIVFDGVAPFRGLLRARATLDRTAFVWMRRGMWRPGTSRGQLVKSALFDRIIEPGDLALDGDRGPTATRSDAERVPPVSMLDVIDLLPREEAARRLGIDPARKTLLVTLGSGRHGEVEAPGATVVRAALDASAWQICVTTAHMATARVPLLDGARVVELVGVYPLVRYLRAFDAAVSAAGYNAVHELLPAGVPTLLVPNIATRTDDQEARAFQLARAGLAMCADPTSPAALAEATTRLVQPGRAEELAAACAGLAPHRRSGGAGASADILVDMARDPPSLSRARRKRLPARRRRPRPIRRLVRLLRRQPAAAARPERPRVHLVEDAARLPDLAAGELALLFSDQISPATLRAPHPVEHILAGTSAAYRAERRRSVAAFYDVGE